MNVRVVQSAPPFARAAHHVCILLAAALACASCKTGPDLSADYAQTAIENYELAVGEFSDKDWDEAIQYADFVRIRFPFSRYAVEAELLIARAEFAQGNYLTAQDAFKQFAKLHPTHQHVRNGWASFMAAASAYMNAPEGFFLMPPAAQRDQSQLREALIELEYYFDHYTGSRTEKFAVKLRNSVKRRLLDHELYVANFYLGRDNPEAAIGRLEAAHAQYPGIGLDAEVLFLLGITYLRMAEVELARTTFSELQSQHPGHHHGKQARVYLKYIYDTYGPADPSRKRPDRGPPVPLSPPRPKNKDRPEHPERKPRTIPDGTTPPSGPSAPGQAPTQQPKDQKPDAEPAEPTTTSESQPEAKPDDPQAQPSTDPTSLSTDREQASDPPDTPASNPSGDRTPNSEPAQPTQTPTGEQQPPSAETPN